METNAQHGPQLGEVHDAGAGYERDRRERSLRIAVAVLSVVLSGLFVPLLSDTFEHGTAVVIFFTASVWAPAMYSMALMLQPWTTDELGRDRAPETIATAAGRWYRSGILANLAILLIVVGLVPAGVVHLTSGRVLEPLAIGVQLLIIGLLVLLNHHTRWRRSPDARARA